MRSAGCRQGNKTMEGAELPPGPATVVREGMSRRAVAERFGVGSVQRRCKMRSWPPSGGGFALDPSRRLQVGYTRDVLAPGTQVFRQPQR